jgi:hypothetical protein
MSNEANYFEVLAGAVAQLEEDSFEARGFIYDRLWNIVLQNLQDQGQDTPEYLASERAAFLAAVRRIEFGERSAAPTVGKPVQEKPPEEIQDKAPEQKRPAKRPVWGRIAVRMVGACAVLAVIWFAYLVIVVRLDAASADRSAGNGANSWSAQLTEAARSVGNLFERRPQVAAGPAQRAVLYEENPATATGHTFSGRAVWRHQVGSGPASAAQAVLSVDAEIPEKRLLMRMSIRRPPDGGEVISHIIEFRFLNSDGSASDMVENVRGVLMKNDELSPGIELVGKVARVQRGVFLMGLSGANADLGRNLKLLRERPWLDVPILMKDKTRGILAVEKGSAGQASVESALTSWGT